MQNGNQYADVMIRPDWRQLLIDELVSILAAIALLVIGGLDGVPYHSVFFCLGLALVFKVEGLCALFLICIQDVVILINDVKA